MSSENVREQLFIGYQNIETGLDKQRIEDWVSSKTENENRGALAGIVFYGACVRECMARGIDNPMEAHLVAHTVLSVFEDEDFENVLYYMIGKPLPTKVVEVIEYYKQNLQADMVKTLNMANNIKLEISFGDETDEYFENDLTEGDND